MRVDHPEHMNCMSTINHAPFESFTRLDRTAAVDKVRQAALSLFPYSFQSEVKVEGVGSYRRGKANSGDIDILISTTDGTSHIGLLRKLLEKLTAQRPEEAGVGERIIAHTLTEGEPHGQRNETEAGAHTHSNQVKGSKFMGLCRVEKGGVMRHLDLFTCPDDSWATHLLHSTGSDMHNRSMRHWAQQCGLALSEKALCPCSRWWYWWGAWCGAWWGCRWW